MKNLFTIIKKELSRVFKDPKLVFTTILMPGLLIFVMYSIMGSSIQSITNPLDSTVATVSVINNNQTFKSACENKFTVTFQDISYADLDTKKDELLGGKIDYIIAFPENFEEKVTNKEKPTVLTFYNPSEEVSSTVNDLITSVLTTMEKNYSDSVYGETTTFVNTSQPIFDQNKLLGKQLSMIFPFLIVTFLFAGAMSIGPETIAGEKERGTMATLLVTPVKRRDIALGKMISLSIVCILSALSSFIGIITSLPRLMGMSSGSVSMNIYGVGEYAAILGVLVVTVLVIIGIVSIISAYAKNVKEASLFVMPVYILFMIVGVTSMFSTSGATNPALYLIPIYNSIQVLVSIFSFDFSITNFLITIVTNIVVSGLLVFGLKKMFDSEKIMFSK